MSLAKAPWRKATAGQESQIRRGELTATSQHLHVQIVKERTRPIAEEPPAEEMAAKRRKSRKSKNENFLRLLRLFAAMI